MNESTVGGKIDQVTGSIKQGVGEAVGNESLANQGAADQVKGEAKETWGNVKDTAADLHNQAVAGSTTSKEPEKSAEPSLRDKITDAAHQVKVTLSAGLDHLKSE